jgi:hypothetical protein
MKNSIRRLIPRWLFRLDEFLLVNYPLLWASRLHFLLYFEVILLVFNILISSFFPVSYIYIPNPTWIFVYGIIINLLVLIAWIYNQTLLDIFYFHGKISRYVSLKIAALFFGVVLVVGISIVIPFVHLNNRIVRVFVDQNLPTSDLDFRHIADRYSGPTTAAVDTSASGGGTNYANLARIQRVIDSLPAGQRFEILVCLQGQPLSSFPNVDLHVDRLGPYVEYLINENRRTLSIFFTDKAVADSIVSSKFDKTVYRWKIRGRVWGLSNMGTQFVKDTLIERYYFQGFGQNDIIFSDRENIQQDLVRYKVQQALDRAYPNDTISDRRQKKIDAVSSSYAIADKNDDEIFIYPFVYLFIAQLIITLVLVLMTFIRFFGVRTTFIGLIPLIVCGGILYGLELSIGSSEHIDFANIGYIILAASLVLFVVLRRNSFYSLLFLHFSAYALVVTLWIMPIVTITNYLDSHRSIKQAYFPRDKDMFVDIPSSVLLLFLFIILFLSKVYRVYCRPAT